MLKMVNSIELCMLPSSEFWLMTLMKNIGGDDHQIFGVYTGYPHLPHFRHPCSEQTKNPRVHRVYIIYNVLVKCGRLATNSYLSALVSIY